MRAFPLILLLILAPVVVFGQTVRVTSGAHDGFSRLVLQTGAPVGWTLFRTAEGYSLQLAGVRREFDLSGVFRLIGRERLAAIRTDPASGRLTMEVGCACHAIAFDHRPGVIVIDLRDGPPQSGSAFELGQDGVALAPLGARGSRDAATERPRPRPADTGGYNWLADALRRSGSPPRVPARPDATLVPPSAGKAAATPARTDLRADVIRSLADGAARGLVEMEMPPVGTQVADEAAAGMAQIRITLPTQTFPTSGLDHEGRACPADADVDPATWGEDGPILPQFATRLSGLVGELDRPDPTAVSRAARFLLFLGFGAEARQLLTSFPPPGPDRAFLESLGHLADDTTDPAPAFAGLQACNNAAALWSLLSDPAPVRGSGLNIVAVRAAFAALPPHLRRLFGPRVVERLVRLDEREAAESVRAAFARVSPADAPAVALVGAGLALSDGDAAEAARLAEAASHEGGPQTREALVRLVMARAAAHSPVSPDIAVALAAMNKEAPAPEVEAALALAHGLSGSFAQAFELSKGKPTLERQVWEILGRIGSDDQVLVHAISPPGTDLATDVGATIAERLLSLGFPDEAEAWIRLSPSPDPLQLARVSLAKGDGRAAMRAVAGLAGEDAAAVRAAAEALAGSGRSVSPDDLPPSVNTGQTGALPDAAAPGLAESLALADRGAATRARLEDVLARLAPP